MNAQIDNDEALVTFPVTFLENLKISPVYCFLDNNGNTLTNSNVTDKVRYNYNNGTYEILEKNSQLRFLLKMKNEAKLNFITNIMIAQMKAEFQYGNVLTEPIMNDNFKKLITSTLQEEPKSIKKIDEISKYSCELIRKAIHSCGFGIAMSIQSQYDEETIKSVALGCLLADSGCLLNEKNHTIAAYNNLEFNFFTKQGKNTNLMLQIIKDHHLRTPHKNSKVDCAKLAINFCYHKNLTLEQRITFIEKSNHIYAPEIFENFQDLYHKMTQKKPN